VAPRVQGVVRSMGIACADIAPAVVFAFCVCGTDVIVVVVVVVFIDKCLITCDSIAINRYRYRLRKLI